MVTRAVRGAAGIEKNDADAIRFGVQGMTKRLIAENGIRPEELISVQFTITSDLSALNPAAAFRELGYDTVPLFCAQEPEIEGSMARVVRVLVTLQREDPAPLKPVYTSGAEQLRPDLAEG